MVKQRRTSVQGDGRRILARTKHKRIFGGRQTSVSRKKIYFFADQLKKKVIGGGTKKGK